MWELIIATTYLDSMLVLIGGGVLDFNLLLQVIHSIAQLQIVRSVSSENIKLSKYLNI